MPTFYDLFVQCAERWPGNTALETQHPDRVESCSYSDLHRMAESIGRWITEKKLARGSRLAILADNSQNWVASYLGIIASGCVVVPLDTNLNTGQLTKLLSDSGTSAIFCDAKHVALASSATKESGLGIVLMSEPRGSDGNAITGHCLGKLSSILESGPDRFTPVDSNSEDLASLIYTSGTTADPKGVMLTHANFLAEVEAVFTWVDLDETDAILGVLPMFHVLAQMANLLLPLVKGARVVYLESLNTTELLRALRERNVTVFAVVPQFFYLIHQKVFEEIAKRGRFTQAIFRTLFLLNRGFRKLGINAGPLFFKKIHVTFGSNMRYLVSGGSRFDLQILRDFQALGIDILQAYGLTETTAAVFANHPENNVLGSVGQALKGVEAKILTRTAEEPAQPDEHAEHPVGEIALRGNLVMKGYWNRPEATEASLREGWLHTGDLGYLDSHRNLFITGRIKEVIVLSNGKNVYPEEIESHYLKSPYIKELAVIGIEGSPGEGRDRLHAVIVPNFDVLRQRKIVNAREVIRFDIENLSAQLPSTKRVASYDLWQEDLPRTTTRKIKRFEVEKKVKENQASKLGSDSEITAERPLTEDENRWLEQPNVQAVLRIVRDAIRNPPQTLVPSFNLELDLGLDSMQRIDLLSRIEEHIHADVPESQMAAIYTLRDLVDAVLQNSAREGQARAQEKFAGWNAILAEEPSDPEVLALARPQPVAELFWYLMFQAAQVAARDLFHLRVEGLENLPKSGPFILSSNHQSFFDPIVLGSVLPENIFRNCFSVGTSEIFGQGFMRRIARWLRVVIVDPDANLVPAMRAGAYGLRHGRVLVLYPEGERSIDGSPKIFKKGAAILSIHLQVPIVPVAIEGFYEAWPRGKKFFQKRAPLKIHVGKPLYPSAEIDAFESAYEALTTKLKAVIVAMWRDLRAGKPD